MPDERLSAANDSLTVLGVAFKGQILTIGNVLDMPPSFDQVELPLRSNLSKLHNVGETGPHLLVSTAMASPSMHGPIVPCIKVDNGTRLLVDDIVTIS